MYLKYTLHMYIVDDHMKLYVVTILCKCTQYMCVAHLERLAIREATALRIYAYSDSTTLNRSEKTRESHTRHVRGYNYANQNWGCVIVRNKLKLINQPEASIKFIK